MGCEWESNGNILEVSIIHPDRWMGYTEIMRTSLSAWWLGHPSEKYEFVNWDDEIPNINGKIKNGNQTTNQL